MELTERQQEASDLMGDCEEHLQELDWAVTDDEYDMMLPPDGAELERLIGHLESARDSLESAVEFLDQREEED